MLSKNGKLALKICENKDNCFDWRGPAVVVDVLRCSTTICALVKRGKKNIRIYDDKAKAVEYKNKTPGLEFFSELEFIPPFTKFDNSPYEALTLSDPEKPALLITTAGTKAILSLKKASHIFIGCFANLTALVKHISKFTGVLPIVPAGLFDTCYSEDILCAKAIRDASLGSKDAALIALEKLKASDRMEHFLSSAGKNASNDLKIALTTDKFDVLPTIEIKNSFGVVKNAAIL